MHVDSSSNTTRIGIGLLMVLFALACADEKSGECKVDMDCPGTQMCQDGECVARTCPQIPCPEGKLCVQGACYPEDCQLTACGTDYVCVDEECVQISCVGVECVPPEECIGGECVSDPCLGVDCNDGNPCTTESCQEGQCVYLNAADGTECGSTNCAGLLWQQTTCVNGACSGTETLQDCNDGQACTNDACDPASGCQYLPLAAGSDCGLCSSCDGSGNCMDDLTSDECPVCQQCGPGGACVPQANLAFCEGDQLTVCDDSGNVESVESCPLGCNSAADPDRCYLLDPSNLDPMLLCDSAYDLVVTEPAVVDTDAGTISVVDPADLTFTVVTQGAGAPEIAVFSFNSIDIQADLTVEGGRALALLSCSDVTFAGIITACGKDRARGPGGWAGGTTEQNGEGYEDGFGKLGPGTNVLDFQAGAGGGGYGGTGGQGGDYEPANLIGGLGGSPYGFEEMIPLLGGSGGGGGAHSDDQNGGYGGGGGGAVQIVSGGNMTISAGMGINACGAGGMVPRALWGSGGGGGAGGGILIEAVSLTLEGTLAANGGGGGGGGGGQWPAPNYLGDGQDGQFSSIPAEGGEKGIHNRGAYGGDGGAGSSCNGQDAPEGEIIWLGGGGGGACGRIRINTMSGTAFIVGGVLSPDESTGLFTQGFISIY